MASTVFPSILSTNHKEDPWKVYAKHNRQAFESEGQKDQLRIFVAEEQHSGGLLEISICFIKPSLRKNWQCRNTDWVQVKRKQQLKPAL